MPHSHLSFVSYAFAFGRYVETANSLAFLAASVDSPRVDFVEVNALRNNLTKQGITLDLAPSHSLSR